MLTHTSNGERFAVLDLYLEADLLGLRHQADDLRDRVLADILPSDPNLWGKRRGSAEAGTGEAEEASSSPSLAQQSSVARLVNAMASVKRGRDYLGEFLENGRDF